MTTRGFGASEFARVAEFFERAVQISIDLKAQEQGSSSKELLASFKQLANSSSAVQELATEVKDWVSTYPVPGDLP